MTAHGENPVIQQSRAGTDGFAPLIEVDGLTKRFPVSKGLFRKPTSFIHAVDDVSFRLGRGESLGFVGESGCGKTTVGKLLVKLLEPEEGRILFHFSGEFTRGDPDTPLDTSAIKGRQVREFRRHAQMIFQDPYESMNPRRTIYDIVSEPLAVQRMGGVVERVDRVGEILTQVGLTPAASFLFRHPHELSGGQRQRVAIARALVIRPQFVVADEPTVKGVHKTYQWGGGIVYHRRDDRGPYGRWSGDRLGAR